MHQHAQKVPLLRPFAVRPLAARNTMYETFIATSMPWITEDVFHTRDDDSLLEHFVGYLMKIKNRDILREWILRCITKATISGVAHHLISEIHGHLTT